MQVLITLTLAGVDTGPFNLYSDLDGYATPFQIGVSRLALLGGYTATTVPDGTSTIRVKSEGACISEINLPVAGAPTTTTTTTVGPVTTTTTTTTVAPPLCYTYYCSANNNNPGYINYVDCFGNPQSQFLDYGYDTYICAQEGTVSGTPDIQQDGFCNP